MKHICEADRLDCRACVIAASAFWKTQESMQGWQTTKNKLNQCECMNNQVVSLQMQPQPAKHVVFTCPLILFLC